MAFLWRKKDAKGLLSVFRVIKDTLNVRDGPLENLWGGGGASEVEKKYSRKGKLIEKKNSCTSINPKKIFILWPKRNSYKEFDNKKKFLRKIPRKFPSPSP